MRCALRCSLVFLLLALSGVWPVSSRLPLAVILRVRSQRGQVFRVSLEPGEVLKAVRSQLPQSETSSALFYRSGKRGEESALREDSSAQALGLEEGDILFLLKETEGEGSGETAVNPLSVASSSVGRETKEVDEETGTGKGHVRRRGAMKGRRDRGGMGEGKPGVPFSALAKQRVEGDTETKTGTGKKEGGSSETQNQSPADQRASTSSRDGNSRKKRKVTTLQDMEDEKRSRLVLKAQKDSLVKTVSVSPDPVSAFIEKCAAGDFAVPRAAVLYGRLKTADKEENPGTDRDESGDRGGSDSWTANEGVIVEVQTLFEPLQSPQKGEAMDIAALLESREGELADQVAAQLGLQRVGVIVCACGDRTTPAEMRRLEIIRQLGSSGNKARENKSPSLSSVRLSPREVVSAASVQLRQMAKTADRLLDGAATGGLIGADRDAAVKRAGASQVLLAVARDPRSGVVSLEAFQTSAQTVELLKEGAIAAPPSQPHKLPADIPSSASDAEREDAISVVFEKNRGVVVEHSVVEKAPLEFLLVNLPVVRRGSEERKKGGGTGPLKESDVLPFSHAFASPLEFRSALTTSGSSGSEVAKAFARRIAAVLGRVESAIVAEKNRRRQSVEFPDRGSEQTETSVRRLHKNVDKIKKGCSR
uniref:Ubiquitin-like domain-containing protein n=1 Tax=Chromera velia CCMP2878 TaxID=1169474 RepID=A0A0G4IDR2_9ALVE|eukprot:Cvel_2328.t1-p1 / transcript=Cvel_2328.t1 / gene=Cvel_2328 / organism=Chromera_velia_CCMP2878 / gene_product=hypothetical protein / transcript_product=hypothetical protein / location=Cvel_scaffold90:4976-13830(+) / protein_length=648 / sequence_SO=supercontig / SO=protein_coding / is_pseudo=false